MGCFGFSKRLNARKPKKMRKEQNARGQKQPVHKSQEQPAQKQPVEVRRAQTAATDDLEPEPWSMGAIKRRTAMLEKERHAQGAVEPLTTSRVVSDPGGASHRQGRGGPAARTKTWTWGADAKISAADLMNLRTLSPDVGERIEDEDYRKNFGGKSDANVGLEDYEMPSSYQRGGLKAM